MTRPDRTGPHRANYERNRKRVFATQSTCGICGRPVDFSLKTPHPMSPELDHLVPVSRGGHPSDIENLQLAHRTCNRQKSNKLMKTGFDTEPQVIGNRNLPHSIDWLAYNSTGQPREQKKQKTIIKVKRKVKK